MYYKCVLLNTFFGILVADSASNGKIDFSHQKVTNMPLTFPIVTAKPGKVTAAEVDDLLHGGSYSNISHHNHTEMLEPALVINVIEEQKISDIKWDTELIEDGTNTEDQRIKYLVQTSHNTDNLLVNHQLLPLVLTISAVVLVITGSVAYFTWRKLEYRCRRRELLINGMDPDDMRHFSI